MIASKSSRELWLALLSILLITGLYGMVTFAWQQIPAASGFFGHMIGVIGFVLMLGTETLYSLRKRSRRAGWGRMSSWLNFHIYTGIVGPYMVLLHSAWKFNGLAGITTLLTAVVVASGFIGRYIYTSIPRSLDGAEVESEAIQREVAAIQAQMQSMGPEQTRKLKSLQRRQDTLRRQAASLANARRMLSLWHTIHIPIGIALFSAAFIHVIAAFYYATLLH